MYNSYTKETTHLYCIRDILHHISGWVDLITGPDELLETPPSAGGHAEPRVNPSIYTPALYTPAYKPMESHYIPTSMSAQQPHATPASVRTRHASC